MKIRSILFVCLGNICRSPTAEGVFQHLVKEAGLGAQIHIDSAGTGAWHVGNPANSKSQATANRHGVTLHSRARQFQVSDFDDFDLILAMDRSNLNDILAMDPTGRYAHKVKLFREFDPTPGDGEVPDPYYGGQQGFEDVYQMCLRTSAAILNQLER
jgi:protein-tyrosine phosphatase